MIKAESITFTYDEGTKALDAVDFHAADGEFVALLASNGSGKTTLIKVLGGILKPTSGRVTVAGKDVDKLPQRDLYQTVGIVFQNPNDQLFAATVAEDVAFGPSNLGLSDDEVQERVRWALDVVGGSDFASRAIHHLSYGQQRRACIAGVLAMRPQVLILDEPTAGLDPAGEASIMQLLHRLNKEDGITIVMATHSVDMIPLMVDRVYVLRRGCVALHGAPSEIFRDRAILEEAHLRLPYVARLIEELKSEDGVKIEGRPLTVGEARLHLLDLIQPELVDKELLHEAKDD